MNRKSYLFMLCILSITTSGVLAQDNKKVLIIGIDGCRSDALTVAQTPVIDQLISTAVYSPDALNDDITISGPGWSAILCGVWSEKHNVTNNNFSGNNYAQYPSIFKYIEQYNSEIHTVSFCHWSPINDEIVGDDADFTLNFGSDLELSQEAAAYLSVNDPDLMFLHFDDIDHAGHSSGFSPANPAYITAIEVVDAQIGTVIQAVQQRPNYATEDWLILLTTDHGGQGTSHGGTSIEHQNVFVIASGGNITPSLILKDSMTVFDGAEDCLDYPAHLAFDGENDQVSIPNIADYNFGTEQDFTIECRVRTTQAADVAIIGNKDWNSGLNPGFVISFSYPAGPEWKVNIGDGSNRTDINIGGSIADNEWHTLSVSFDRDGMMSMYQDGSFVASESIANIGDITNAQGLFFGTDIFENFAYSGQLAEVRIWGSILSEETLADWSCSSLDDSHPNWADLIGYWPLQDTQGSAQAIDESANLNHGIINGPIWSMSDSLIVYDYSNTSRLVDVPVSALTHLCVPVLDSWNLDGISLIPLCNTTGNFSPPQFQWRIHPNPNSQGELYFNTAVDEDYQLSIFNNQGQLVQEAILGRGNRSIVLNVLDTGAYFLHFETATGAKGVSTLIIQ